jgi:hypothetical protein
MVVANIVDAGQALLDLSKPAVDVASAKVSLDEHRGVVGFAQANGRAVMDRKAAPKVGKSFLELTTHHVCPAPQHGRRAFVVQNAMLRAHNGQFIQTLRHGVRFSAILIQHGVEDEITRKAARKFKPTRKRNGLA